MRGGRGGREGKVPGEVVGLARGGRKGRGGREEEGETRAALTAAFRCHCQCFYVLVKCIGAGARKEIL